jgi:hypothetical protein
MVAGIARMVGEDGLRNFAAQLRWKGRRTQTGFTQSRKAAKRQRKLASYEVAGLASEIDIRRGATVDGTCVFHLPFRTDDQFVRDTSHIVAG